MAHHYSSASLLSTAAQEGSGRGNVIEWCRVRPCRYRSERLYCYELHSSPHELYLSSAHLFFVLKLSTAYSRRRRDPYLSKANSTIKSSCENSWRDLQTSHSSMILLCFLPVIRIFKASHICEGSSATSPFHQQIALARTSILPKNEVNSQKSR